jgi:hypothetical protein
MSINTKHRTDAPEIMDDFSLEGLDLLDALDKIVKDNFGNSLELFVHTDGCLDFSCKICSKQNCAQRKSNTVQTVTWTVDNVSSNEKHRVIEN